MQNVTGDYLVAADSALGLIGRVEVMQAWAGPSALQAMSVGALAAHLGSQVLSVRAALVDGTGVSSEAPVLLLEHYQRVAWANSGIDDESNVTIRDGAEQSAAGGHGDCVSSIQQALDEVRSGLASGDLPRAIRMPWWDWSLSFEDFLVTRMMEIVVHSDDLAVSVEVEPPTLPEPVLGSVLALLVGVSLRRHGQAAVVRALSRAERAPASISAF